tara:strand:- start:303 stop:890 length:588 start_codon:yes stop_codon:yes gene_type:complete
MLNSKDEISNEGEVEGLDEGIEEDQEAEPVEVETQDIETSDAVENTESQAAEVAADLNEGDLIDDVLKSDVQPNDLLQGNTADVNDNNTSVTAQNMQKLMKENEDNKLKFNSGELLPKEVNNDWFETDFSHAQVNVDDSNLVVTDRYIVGVNTVGQSLKNPSYDLRAAPACPKFTVSPWQQSTIEPDFNIKNMME